ncbi:MAG: hypothetical protein LBL39_02855, partial [Planctomycetaceae bacterium]|nr:hypothetical protein [Planctomycetaceae bacterium]
MAEFSDIREEFVPEGNSGYSESADILSSDGVDYEGGIGGELSEVERLRGELEEARNRSLRALADLENFRVRSNRQTVEERK